MAAMDAKQDTKQLILDAAEMLFASRGYHATSIRAITGKAGVNIAAVNYHFGTKTSLLEAVFERRLVPLNRIRIERLNSVRESAKRMGRKPLSEDVLKAFVEPMLQTAMASHGASAFMSIVQQAFTSPDNTAREVFMRLVKPVLELFLGTLREALPDVPDNSLKWKLLFAMGAITHTMRTGLIKQSRSPFPFSPPEGDPDMICDMLVRFLAAGMEAP
jgi:AcrR family transcriptional regulator